MTNNGLAVAIIIATILGPILAVQVSEFLGRRRELTGRRAHLFRRLMATRAANLSVDHVEALNLIDLDFRGVRPVLDAWKAYLDHLSAPQVEPDRIVAWNERSTDLLIDLLAAMGQHQGYDFDKTHIRRAGYYPRGYGDAEADHRIIRTSLAKILTGGASLPIEISLSSDAEKLKMQLATQGALADLLAGRSRLKIQIVGDANASADAAERAGREPQGV